VYAHHDPQSFCQVVDLYAIKFDHVYRERDGASYVDANVPLSVLERMNLKQQVMDGCRGPIERWLASRGLRGKSLQETADFIRSRMPKDARRNRRVAWADGLACISPVYFCNFPAILRRWIRRGAGVRDAMAKVIDEYVLTTASRGDQDEGPDGG
jgi:NAD(P)H dehydrogenase (quinone)